MLIVSPADTNSTTFWTGGSPNRDNWQYQIGEALFDHSCKFQMVGVMMFAWLPDAHLAGTNTTYRMRTRTKKPEFEFLSRPFTVSVFGDPSDPRPPPVRLVSAWTEHGGPGVDRPMDLGFATSGHVNHWFVCAAGLALSVAAFWLVKNMFSRDRRRKD